MHGALNPNYVCTPAARTPAVSTHLPLGHHLLWSSLVRWNCNTGGIPAAALSDTRTVQAQLTDRIADPDRLGKRVRRALHSCIAVRSHVS